MGTVCFINGHCMGTVRALMGTVRGRKGHFYNQAGRAHGPESLNQCLAAGPGSASGELVWVPTSSLGTLPH